MRQSWSAEPKPGACQFTLPPSISTGRFRKAEEKAALPKFLVPNVRGAQIPAAAASAEQPERRRLSSRGGKLSPIRRRRWRSARRAILAIGIWRANSIDCLVCANVRERVKAKRRLLALLNRRLRARPAASLGFKQAEIPQGELAAVEMLPDIAYALACRVGRATPGLSARRTIAAASSSAFSGAIAMPAPASSKSALASPSTPSTIGHAIAMASNILEGSTVLKRSSFLSSTRLAPAAAKHRRHCRFRQLIQHRHVREAHALFQGHEPGALRTAANHQESDVLPMLQAHGGFKHRIELMAHAVSTNISRNEFACEALLSLEGLAILGSRRTPINRRRS